MLSFGALSFAAPWALVALAALPAIWWLLRLTPPAPFRMVFPPLRILARLVNPEETSAKSPLWLILLRLLLATALILALASPVMNAGREFQDAGPLLIVVDDGWAAGRDWPARQTALAGLLDQAAREVRPIALTTTAARPSGAPEDDIDLLRADTARSRAETLRPQPWPTDLEAALNRIERSSALGAIPPGEIIWLSDGLALPATETWIAGLQAIAPVRILRDSPGRPLALLQPPERDGSVLRVPADRAGRQGAATLWLRAFAADGTLLARQPMEFADSEAGAASELALPSELRNRLVRLDIEDQGTAGAVMLLDERWLRRPVGLVTGNRDPDAQPLLSEFFYVERALEPFTEIRRGTIDSLLERELAVMVIADASPLTEGDAETLGRWMENGGILVRFAGPMLAENAADPLLADLLPVPLRPGGRTLGGALSWSQPAKLSPFAPESPFAGLTVPDDVTVSRQVLAQPTLDLAERTWARLADGTPLITAAGRGDGWTVLVHTSANASWSDLAISGLFVEMLQEIVGLSQGAAAGTETATLAPLETLDGLGVLGAPPPTAIGIEAGAFETTHAGPDHPPGFYGRGEARRALNLAPSLPPLLALTSLPQAVTTEIYGKTREIPFRPWLLGFALVLFLVDLLAAMILRGLLRPRQAVAAAVLLVALPLATGRSEAQSLEQLGGDDFALEAALMTRLAYVITGDDGIDGDSRAGLTGLSVIVNRRTAADLGEPVGLDIEADDLLFFPFLYWPLVDGTEPSENAAIRIRDYLSGGGVILFDSRDPNGAVALDTMRTIADRLQIPPLTPVPQDHVLSRSYYLLRDFPGRWTGGTLWIERAGERINDGVSPVIAGSNDWAGAWAMDPSQRPLYAVVPGGERQREMAYRFGINLVMYTLTGNYKGDQVHLPAILERLGL